MADISEAMVEAALAAYAKSADIEASFEVHKDWLIPAMRAAIEAALSAAPASAQMEGMVLVPREPNEAMTRAAIDAIPMDKYMQIGSRLSNVTLSTDECATIYRAMLAAAPLPTSEGSNG